MGLGRDGNCPGPDFTEPGLVLRGRMLGGPLAIRNVAKDEQADLDEFSAVF